MQEILSEFHPYDLFMIVVLVGATIFGAWKGMAWQVASLGSLVASFFVAVHFSDEVAPLLGTSEPWNRFLAMFILYLATSFVIWMAFRMVARFIDRVKLKEFDRQMGAIVGAAKGILLCVAITFFVVTLSASGRDAVLASRSGIYIALFIDKAHAVMPEEVHDVLHPYLHRLDEELQPDQPSERTALDHAIEQGVLDF